MKKELVSKILVLGIIFLFVCVGVQPAFAINVENQSLVPPFKPTITGSDILSVYSISNDKSEVTEKSEKFFMIASVRAIYCDVNKYWNETINDWTYDGLFICGLVSLTLLFPFFWPYFMAGWGPVRGEFSKKDVWPDFSNCAVNLIPSSDGKIVYYKLFAYGFFSYSSILNILDMQNYLNI